MSTDTALTIIIPFLPLIAALAFALYTWLESKLPANTQKVLAAHEAQVHNIITTVVTAIEQTTPYASNKTKKQNALLDINQIMADEKARPMSATWIDTMLEEIVSMLPATYDRSDTTPEDNPLLDTVTQTAPKSGIILNPLPPITQPLPVVANGTVSSPLVPSVPISDAL
jgi:hypothetical protein